jgi:hypothetical protein
MSIRTVKYTAGEIGRVWVIEDFLPPPDRLVPREENVMVTLSLSRRSLDFFKREAKKRRVPYQRMICGAAGPEGKEIERESAVARMERSEIRGRGARRLIPDCASLHPGYAATRNVGDCRSVRSWHRKITS